MKSQVWVYIVVAVLSMGAGVAIAGVPTFETRNPTIQSSSTSTTTTTTTSPLSESAGSTVEPPITTAGGDVEETADATQPDTVESEEAADSTITTSSTTTTTTTTVPLLDRDALEVAVANGAEVGGAATNGSQALEDAGYFDVASFDGLEVFDGTVVFASGSAAAEAERLAQDIGIDLNLIFPIDTAPEVSGLTDEVQLLVYLGRNVVDIPFFN